MKRFAGTSREWLIERCTVVETGYGSPCWLWSGYVDAKGYAKCTPPVSFGMGRLTFRVHRLAYNMLVERFDPTLTIDHLCKQRACCNPDHLEPVPLVENIRRAHPRRTHCARGHALTPDNVLVKRTRIGERQCRTCAYAANRRWLANTRAASDKRIAA